MERRKSEKPTTSLQGIRSNVPIDGVVDVVGRGLCTTKPCRLDYPGMPARF